MRALFIIAALAAIIPVAASAQEEAVAVPIEFRLPERQLFVGVDIGEAASVKFALDSGAGFTLVPTESLERMGARWVGIETVFLPDGMPVEAFRFAVDNFRIGECNLGNVEVLSSPMLV